MNPMAIRRSVLGAMVIAILGVTCQSASAAWTISSPTLPAGATESTFNSISCQEKFCWAVGSYRESGVLKPIAYDAIHNSYELPPSPGSNPELLDISCARPASNFLCMAVGRFTNGTGNYQVFAEKFTWAGGWELQTPPAPTGSYSSELGTVSCASETECVAVGQYHKLPVGTQYLAERWSGGTWTPETPAEPPGAGYQWLSALSCPTSGKCVGTGEYLVSPWGVGNGRMETETYVSGTGWNYQGGTPAAGVPFGPGSGTEPITAADTCITTTECIAVGYYLNTTPALQMLAWKRIAASPGWEAQTIPAVTGATDLHGIECWTAITACMAVGKKTVSGTSAPLLEKLSAGGWTQVTVPTVAAPAEASFNRIACETAFTCFAVGRTVSGTTTTAFLERGP